MTRPHRLGLCLIAGCALLPVPGGSAEVGGFAPARIEDVEAAYVVNFIRYTEWPAAALPGPDRPFVVTVIGDDGVRDALRALSARAAATLGHPLEVRARPAPRRGSRETVPVEALAPSHVVFVGRLPPGVVASFLRDFGAPPTLTIGNSPGFAAAGGMIELVHEGSKLVFEANLASLRASGLALSARVLSLARDVRGER